MRRTGSARRARAQNGIGLVRCAELSGGFTDADYAAMYRGELIVSDEREQKPETGISVILDRGAEQTKQEAVV